MVQGENEYRQKIKEIRREKKDQCSRSNERTIPKGFKNLTTIYLYTIYFVFKYAMYFVFVLCDVFFMKRKFTTLRVQ